jgi:hypothetical protein
LIKKQKDMNIKGSITSKGNEHGGVGGGGGRGSSQEEDTNIIRKVRLNGLKFFEEQKKINDYH